MNSSTSVTNVREAPDSIGNAVAKGAAWSVILSGLNKVTALGSQILIAWFLAPEEIGLVATALSIVGILSAFLGAHLQRVLVQRQVTFEREAPQVFWLSVCLNTSLALLIAAASGTFARAFGEPRLAPLLYIIAAAVPVMAFPVAYGAKLLIAMRFRLMSSLSFCEGMLRNLGGALLAACGVGSASLVIPLFFSALFATLAQRFAAGPVVRVGPRPREWHHLLAPASWLMLNALVTTGAGYATNLVIAAAQPASVVGLYFWGFSLSSQFVFLTVTSLQEVFFPALSKMGDDPDRQRSAFLRAASTLLAVTTLICILQVILARPVIRLVFSDKWLGAVGVVQWLSIGFLTQPLQMLASALLMARGAYRKMVLVTAMSALLTLSAAFLGSRIGDQSRVAQLVGMVTFLTNVWLGSVALRLVDSGWGDLVQLLSRPFMVGTATGVFALTLPFFLGNLPPLVEIALAGPALALFYIALLRMLFPHLLMQLRLIPARLLRA